MQYLQDDNREPRLDAVVLGLCAEMLVVTGLETDSDKALQKVDEAVTSGRALEVFAKMVAALGGPADFVDNPNKHLAQAPVVRPVYASGYLTALDTFAVGNAIIELGGGRRIVGAPLNMAVGFSQFAALGTELDEQTPLCLVHAANEADADKVTELVLDACTTSTEALSTNPIIAEILTANS